MTIHIDINQERLHFESKFYCSGGEDKEILSHDKIVFKNIVWYKNNEYVSSKPLLDILATMENV